MYEDILYDVDDPVAVITLNRPAALNAWTSSMDGEVRDALVRASADPAVVGIVIRGAGRAFCAGADMNLLSALSWLLPRLVGPAVALDLLFSSRRVMGQEAVQLGLANYLVEADDLMGFCRDYIVNIARNCSPTSLAIMKRQVYEQLHRGLGAAELESQGLMIESFGRPDFKEGVQSFLEKRAPDFVRRGG